MAKNTTPPLSEFINLDKRKAGKNAGMKNRVTVAVYDVNSGYQTLTVRISEDLATSFGLAVGARLSCLVHPDAKHIALKPVARGERGVSLYRQRSGRAFIFQTSLAEGTLDPHGATEATLEKKDGALVITLES